MVSWPHALRKAVCRALKVFLLYLLHTLVLFVRWLAKVKRAVAASLHSKYYRADTFKQSDRLPVVGVVIAQQTGPKDLERVALLLSWINQLGARSIMLYEPTGTLKSAALDLQAQLRDIPAWDHQPQLQNGLGSNQQSSLQSGEPPWTHPQQLNAIGDIPEAMHNFASTQQRFGK
ncbi:hypothetical protein WJX74_005982 [Apatococcus lobatus]|uniref:ditrans,polycis-polyprenyl diphosphate synthase [(2E,6E)-farnesyldiphosphate specific] n=2 Tax=Apatococcus TaxID=904362 RepID=A0AAW1T902_9CHLO